MPDRAVQTNAPRVVIVGGGIAGLAAAHRLTTLLPNAEITLLERDDRLGGKIITERVEGFVIEGGPDSFLAAKPRGVGLCQELGLGGRLIGTNQATRGAFVSHGGRLHPLPEGLTGLVPTRLGPMARSRLFSPWGKVRMALDFVRPPRRGTDDETLAVFVSRRLGTQVYERLVEPLMAGIYAGDGRQLSLAATFPQLRAAEVQHGGVIKGVLASRKQAPAAVGRAKPSPFQTPRGGLGELVDTLARRLAAAGVIVRTGVAVSGLSVDPTGDARYRVMLTTRETLLADAVIVATPAFAAADLVDAHAPALAADLRAIPHVSTATVSLAYSRQDLPRPLHGHGYVIPRIAERDALACTWVSAKWPGRAPEGAALLRIFLGRADRESVLNGTDDDLVTVARAELRATMGIAATPRFARVHRWPNGMPQYTLGHLERLARIDAHLGDSPGLFLAGHGYRGVGIPDCIRSGEDAAAAIERRSVSIIR